MPVFKNLYYRRRDGHENIQMQYSIKYVYLHIYTQMFINKYTQDMEVIYRNQ